MSLFSHFVKDVNPSNYEHNDKFIDFMSDEQIDSFGNWMFNNGHNHGVSEVEMAFCHSPWISVHRCPPPSNTTILIVAGNHRASAYYDPLSDTFKLTENDSLYYSKDKVTHWLPIPEIPQEE